MSKRVNHNTSATPTDFVGRFCETPIQETASDTDALQFQHEKLGPIRHLYIHIPFCARICPYCAFYKDTLDRSQTQRFCEAIVQEIKALAAEFAIAPATIFFGGGTPSALSTDQLEFLLSGLNDVLDLSELTEFTLEANPGSVSARKAAL